MESGNGQLADGADRPVTQAHRELAVAALVVHREEGRLDSVQFEDRQVLADSARTWADLDRLFVDLPEPHPRRPVPPPSGGAVPEVPGTARRGAGGWSTRLVAATPILVLLLFFLTWRWQVFLLIPLVMILAGKSGKGR